MQSEEVQTISKGKSLSSVPSGRLRMSQALDSLTAMCDAMIPGDRLPTHTELVRKLQMPERTVLAALKELHRIGRVQRIHGSGTYVMDASASDVQGNRFIGSPKITSRTIVALARPDNSFYDRSVERLSLYVGLAQHDLVVFPVPAAADQIDFAQGLGDAAGFIVFSNALLDLARGIQQRGQRIVCVGTPRADTYADVPTIYCDQEAGGFAVTSHLLKLGHRNIAFAYKNIESLRETLRWTGHMRAIVEGQRNGLRIKASVIDEALFTQLESDAAASKAFFAQIDAPTAIVAWNDLEALHLISMLSRNGISVPSEVSVTGYDASPHGALVHPSLTTVDNALDQQLRAAVDLLTRATPPPSTYTVVMQPQLILRESSAAMATRTDL